VEQAWSICQNFAKIGEGKNKNFDDGRDPFEGSQGNSIVILLQKSILDGIGERRKEVEDMGEFPFEVCPEFFDRVGVRRIGRQVN
jgi:hypothetical protein